MGNKVTEISSEFEDVSWQDEPRYESVVRKLLKKYPSNLEGVEDQSCFAWLWKDDDGECPEVSCKYRSMCQQAWQLAQVETSQSIPKPLEENSSVWAHTRSIDSHSRLRPLKKASKIRHKFKDSSKYDRKGYQDQGRPVDSIISAFTNALGNPVRVGGARTVAKEVNAPLVVKETASYHSVIVSGIVVARLWTNSAKSSIVDFVPELFSEIQSYFLNLQELKLDYMTEPVKCPDKSWLKVRPCTHRVKIRQAAAATVLGQLILEKFNQ